MLGTMTDGALSTSGTETCSGGETTGGIAAPVLAAGGMGGNGSLRTGVEPFSAAGDATSEGAIVLMGGEDGRADAGRRRTPSRGSSTAGAGFVAGARCGAAGASVSWR